jgi:DNA polymerase-3 subunit alpha
MLCIGTNSKFEDNARMRFDGDQFYMKSEAEMRSALANFEDACDNTVEIAAKCNFELDEAMVVSMATSTSTRLSHGKILPLPVIRADANDDTMRAQAQQVLRAHNCATSELEPDDLQFYADSLAGLRRLYGDPVPAEAIKRFEYEFSVIVEQGFSAYFLVVAEFVGWAKANAVGVGPGRGSAAGSIISYALGITTLDPLSNGLLFERFMSMERVEMPDIDIDFDESGRLAVIEHIREVYGVKSVAHVITYSSMKARQAVNDTARIFEYPVSMAQAISKKITGGPAASLRAALGSHESKELNRSQSNPDLIAEYQNNPDTKRIVDAALALEGTIRGEGMHASAVIISPVDVDSLIPVKLDTKGGVIITQYDGKSIADLGLLKMDFLGLRTLNVLMKAKEYVQTNHAVDIDLDAIPLDDPKIFELLQRGDTAGVFQVESSGMTALIRSMNVDRYSDVVAAIALFRPGPLNSGMLRDFVDRKTGKRRVAYYDERLADILKETYGAMVYQEQVMQISMRMSGFTAGESDVVRKAMAKKNIKLMKEDERSWADGSVETMQDHWLNGAERNGYSRKTAQTIWDDVEKFAEYAFNKSHSAAYAILVMQTAWIKAHYPLEFMAAVLSSFVGKADRLTSYITETRRSGIAVLPPDVNSSGREFTPLADGIRFGLAGIRGVGAAAADFIIAEREAKGPYTSLHDFVFRIPNRYCNKGGVDALIKSGALDSTGYTRRQMIRLLEIDKLMEIAAKRHQDKAEGQVTIFDMFEGDAGAEVLGFEDVVPEPDGVEWDRREKLKFEKGILKMYVSDHPLSPYEAALSQVREYSLGVFLEADEDEGLLGGGEDIGDGMGGMGAGGVGAGVGEDMGGGVGGRGGDDVGGGMGGSGPVAVKARPPQNRNITLAGMITAVSPMVSRKGDRMAKFVLEDTEGSVDVVVFPGSFENCKHILEDDAIVRVRGRYEHTDRGAQILLSDMTKLDIAKAHQDSKIVEFFIRADCFNQLLSDSLLKLLRLYPGPNAVVLYVEQSDASRMRAELPVTIDASSARMRAEVEELLGSCSA